MVMVGMVSGLKGPVLATGGHHVPWRQGKVFRYRQRYPDEIGSDASRGGKNHSNKDGVATILLERGKAS